MDTKTIKLTDAQQQFIEKTVKEGAQMSSRMTHRLIQLGLIDGTNNELTDAGTRYAIAAGWLAAPAKANDLHIDSTVKQTGSIHNVRVGDIVVWRGVYAQVEQVDYHATYETLCVIDENGVEHEWTDANVEIFESRETHAARLDALGIPRKSLIDTRNTADLATNDDIHAADATPASEERASAVDDVDVSTTDWRHEWNKRHVTAAMSAEFRTAQQDIIVSMYNEIMSKETLITELKVEKAHEHEHFETHRVMREIALATALGLHRDTFLNVDTEDIVDAITATRDQLAACVATVASVNAYIDGQLAIEKDTLRRTYEDFLDARKAGDVEHEDRLAAWMETSKTVVSHLSNIKQALDASATTRTEGV